MVRGAPAGGPPHLFSRLPTERESRELVVQTTRFRKLARTKVLYVPSTQTSLRDNFRNRRLYEDETGLRFCVALCGAAARRVL